MQHLHEQVYNENTETEVLSSLWVTWHWTADRAVRVEPEPGHCVVFLGRTLHSHSVSHSVLLFKGWITIHWINRYLVDSEVGFVGQSSSG